MTKFGLVVLVLVAVLPFDGTASGQPSAELESGVVLSGYNDVQIPGDTGTLISLSQDLSSPASLFARFRLTYIMNDRHRLSILAAPLRIEATGKMKNDVYFIDRSFSAGTSLKSVYRFDSYRFTYRYDFVRTPTWNVGAGITVKIRDAAISLEGGGQRAEKRNTGFVPLINFRMSWQFAPKWQLGLTGDALAAPQGRAEDVLLSLERSIRKGIHLYAGYRVLEGGANNEEVYNFAMLNYAAVGIIAEASAIAKR